MSIKDIFVIILILSGGALFLVLQKYSHEQYSSNDQSKAPVAGKPAPRYRAPDFTLADLEEIDFRLSHSREDVVALMFWTTW